MKQRLKSYKFWVSLFASIIIFINALGSLCGFKIDEVAMESVIMGFCGVLVVLGIVDKPKANQEQKAQENQPQESEEEKAVLPEKNNKDCT